MKKLFASLFVVVLLGLAAPYAALAQTVPSVNVPDHCTVIDTDGSSHTYESRQFLGICALQAAVDAGSVSGVKFSNAYPSLGLFVTAIGGVTADPDSQYWALLQNGAYASLGLSQLTVSTGDTIVLELHDFSDNFLGSRLTLNVDSLTSTPNIPAVSRGGGSITLHDPFDLPLALGYIWSMQKSDGSFGSPLLDDWVAIASAGGGDGDLRAHLSAYEVADPPALSSTTDYERHAMALEALGINPYSGTSVDTITPIVNSFDGTQFGDPTLDNDDIFAVFPLLHAGYSVEDDIIVKTIAFIISRQHADGSWDGSVDLTGAAIQALSLGHSLPDTSGAIQKALGYLRTQQANDASFGNVSATSWVIQAITAVGQNGDQWDKGTYQVPEYYLTTKQERDGGVEPESTDTLTRVWATAYAVPAMEHKTWDALLASFSKPAPAATTTAATSTPTIATTTEPATATPATATDTSMTPEAQTDESVSQPPTDVPATAAAETASSTPQTDSPQTAAAATSNEDPVGNFWHAVISFFGWLF